MINNVEELLAEAEKMQTTEAKVKVIMYYFLENVKYNYAYLFAKGYLNGTISGISYDLMIAMNKTRTDDDSEFALTRLILKGESKIFDDILKIRDENSENYNEFVSQLRNYITVELKKHMENEDIVTGNVDKVMKNIEEGLRKKQVINFEGDEYEVNHDLSMVLTDFLLEPKKYFPPEFNNGLITNGVCEDYTLCLVPILQRVGIEAHDVEGTSEFKHRWIIVKDGEEYKSIDLTRAVFIRDGGIGIPEEQTSEDWLYSDLADMFKMQETRSIIKIDGKELPNVIDGKNYDEETFKKIMEEPERKDSSFTNILKRGLEEGITETESLNAQQAEIANEREEKSHE